MNVQLADDASRRFMCSLRMLGLSIMREQKLQKKLWKMLSGELSKRVEHEGQQEQFAGGEGAGPKRVPFVCCSRVRRLFSTQHLCALDMQHCATTHDAL